MTIIKDILKIRKREKNQNDSKFVRWTLTELKDAEYTLHAIRVGQLAQIKNIRPNKANAGLVKDNIVKEDLLMISAGDNWYMDIESGEYYEMADFVGAKLQNPNHDLYIVGYQPFYHECYDTVKAKNLEPNDMLSAYQLRDLYKEHTDKYSVTI